MDKYFYEENSHLKVGETMRMLRTQAGLSQTKLCDGICDRTTLVHLENGNVKHPTITLLNMLCKRLCITLDDFFLLAYDGKINQLWLKKNEIDSLMKTREYKKANDMAQKYASYTTHPVDKQYLHLVNANYLYSLGKYNEAKEVYLSALSITSSNIKDEVYTINEMRLINGIIYCNWRLDNKLSTPETLNYIRILNNSIYNYQYYKDYRLIISLMLCTVHFYFTLKQYDDTIIIINNAIELSNRYSCYDFLGNLWLILANCHTVLNNNEKAKEYFEKSNTFFKLFNEDTILKQSLNYQKELYDSIEVY